MLELFLQRHGKATKYVNSTQDFYRNLDKNGISEVNKTRDIFSQKQIRIDEILSSAANRAKETAEIMNQFIDSNKIKYEEELFLAGSDKILMYIRNEAKMDKILYVGHNFGISDIVGYLTGEHMNMSTSMVVHISFDVNNWSEISKESGKIINTFIP